MKRILWIFVVSLALFSFVSCSEVYAEGVGGEVYYSSEEINLVIGSGTPYYHNGVLWCYYYNGLYYYPFRYGGYWYLRPYRHYYPWGHDFRFRPLPGDYRFRPPRVGHGPGSSFGGVSRGRRPMLGGGGVSVRPSSGVGGSSVSPHAGRRPSVGPSRVPSSPMRGGSDRRR